MSYFLLYLFIVFINHVLLFTLCRQTRCFPKKNSPERFLIVSSMFIPFVNFVTLFFLLIGVVIGHDNAPLVKFYSFIFGDKNV